MAKPTKKKTSGARAVAAARSSGNRRGLIVGIIAVVVVGVVVIGGALLSSNRNQQTEGAKIPVVNTATGYPSARQDGAVLEGKDTAKVTLDVYADFLCPICHQFEQAYGSSLHDALDAGTIKVRYHMLPLLDERSDPPGYSSLAASASLCAADGGKFQAFHDSLYGAQPEEGGRGYDADQLVALGRDLGLGDPFADCVKTNRYQQDVRNEMTTANNTAAFQDPQTHRFRGTPTVAVGGKPVDFSDPNWLTKVIGTKSSE